MLSTHPLVTVILLSYNRPTYLREALASISAQSYPNIEVIVIDNPSLLSGEIEEIVSEFEQARLLKNSVNLGYAGGMNVGIKEAKGYYICLTEDDIVLDRECISRLAEYSDTHQETTLAGPIQYNMSDRTVRCAGGEFTLGAVYKKRIIGAGEKDTGQFGTSIRVSYVPGSTIFCRLSEMRRLNGFREDFFMYLEDTEFCARVLKAGGQITVIPGAKVFHFDPSGAQAADVIEYHKIKNLFSLYALHAPFKVLPEFLCRYAVLGMLRDLLESKAKFYLKVKALCWVLANLPKLVKDRFATVNLIENQGNSATPS